MVRGATLAAMAALSVAALVVPTAGAFATGGAGQHVLEYFLAAETTTSGPYLATEAGPAATFQGANMGAGSGPMTMAGYYDDSQKRVAVFEAKQPLDRDYWLNLSQPFAGGVHVSSSAGKALSDANACQRVNYPKVQVDAFVDDARILSWQVTPTGPYLLSGCWDRINPVSAPPEVPMLPEGGLLRVEVTFLNGGPDFLVGTGGAQASSIQFRTFLTDPLGGDFFLEEGVLRTAQIQDTGAESSAAAPAMMLLAMGGLGAVRGGRRVLVVAALAFAVPLAGCLAPDAPGLEVNPGAAGPARAAGVEQTIVNHTVDNATGLGVLQGWVTDRDRLGAPVAGAFVSVVATNLFVEADANGYYRFGKVTPRNYTVRIDAEGYLAAEVEAKVLADRTTILNVSISATTGTGGRVGGNDAPHLHDDWGTQRRMPFQSFEFTPGFGFGFSYSAGEKFTCGAPEYCDVSIPIDTEKRVLPGTGRIVIELTWDAAPGDNVNHMGLAVRNPVMQGSSSYRFTPRESGEPFAVSFWPHLADPGHQDFTNWQFTLRLPQRTIYAQWEPLVWVGGPVQVDMWIEKAVVPFEPAHEDFWAGADQIVLFEKSGESISTGVRDFPYTGGTGYLGHWQVPEGSWVPPGASHIEGTLSWTVSSTYPGLPHTQWTLAFRPASIASPPLDQGGPQVDYLPRVEVVERGSTSLSWKVDLSTPEAQAMTDQYYQFLSYWEFFLDDGQDPVVDGGTPSYRFVPRGDVSVQFTMDATVVRGQA